MTVQLDWPPEVVDRLAAEARQQGLSLDAYVLNRVLQNAASEPERRLVRQNAGARIRDVRARVKPDPEGWTSRDYIEHGRG